MCVCVCFCSGSIRLFMGRPGVSSGDSGDSEGRCEEYQEALRCMYFLYNSLFSDAKSKCMQLSLNLLLLIVYVNI